MASIPAANVQPRARSAGSTPPGRTTASRHDSPSRPDILATTIIGTQRRCFAVRTSVPSGRGWAGLLGCEATIGFKAWSARVNDIRALSGQSGHRTRGGRLRHGTRAQGRARAGRASVRDSIRRSCPTCRRASRSGCAANARRCRGCGRCRVARWDDRPRLSGRVWPTTLPDLERRTIGAPVAAIAFDAPARSLGRILIDAKDRCAPAPVGSAAWIRMLAAVARRISMRRWYGEASRVPHSIGARPTGPHRRVPDACPP